MRSLLSEDGLAAQSRLIRNEIADVVVCPDSFYRLRLKRALDIVGALLLLVILTPVFALVTVGVLVFLHGRPILVTQERVGRDGRAFRFYKFRSMMHDRRLEQVPYLGTERRVSHKSEDDPRHRPFGRALRTVSLDELPQLVNVLKGDMSLVGPRPELLSVAREKGMLGHPRELVRPGLTGAFQVSSLRGEGDLASGLHLDVAYVADARLRTDLILLLKTVRAILQRTGT